MGISINLYRVSKAEAISDIGDLEKDIEDSEERKVDLYKMTQDLAVIFSNQVDPFEDIASIPYKMLFGNMTHETAGWRDINGFIPTSEVKLIVEWIIKNEVDSMEGFNKMYDNLSIEVKKGLKDIGSPAKEELYSCYVKPLTDFYYTAQKDNNSVVISGE